MGKGRFAVRQTIARIVAALRDVVPDADRLGTVELVLAETLNNVVDHAYAEHQPPGPVTVICRGRDDLLEIRITDRGAPMPQGRIPHATIPPCTPPSGDLPEGGFGWFLIRGLSQRVTYTRRDGVNTLTVSFDLADIPGTDPDRALPSRATGAD